MKKTLTLELTPTEWFQLKMLKAELQCNTWNDFFRKLIRNREILVRTFSELPP